MVFVKVCCMVNAAFLDPSIEIVLCDLIWKMQDRMIRLQKFNVCILISYPRPGNIEIVWSDLGPDSDQRCCLYYTVQ